MADIAVTPITTLPEALTVSDSDALLVVQGGKAKRARAALMKGEKGDIGLRGAKGENGEKGDPGIGGPPSGYYANISALQTAYPSGKDGVFITLDNGNWNFWNGSKWVSGGLYQAPLAVVQTTGTSQTSVMSQDAVTKQLDTNKTDFISQLESIEYANARDTLRILNYAGNYENVHPKVLYFTSKLWGYQYWMAYTPYPGSQDMYENPHIAVSNDGFTWTVPAGLVNPITPKPAGGYNSDTHLVYRSDTGKMELWYRPIDSASTASIVRKLSSDGVNWSDAEIIFSGRPKTDLLSPSILFENGVYKMWYIDSISRTIYYQESIGNTVSNWATPVALNVDFKSLLIIPWHLDVINNEVDGYDLVVQAYKGEEGQNQADLFYVKQYYNGTFTIPRAILRRSKNAQNFDYKCIYRSSVVKINNVYYVYYPGLSATGNWAIGLAYGKNILGLNGIQKIPINPVLRMTGNAGYAGANLIDFNIADINTIIVDNISITITSFKNAKVGQQLIIVLYGGSAQVTLVYNSSRLLTPGFVNKTLNSSYFGCVIVFTMVDQAKVISITN